jgi:hypothetical protein
MVELKISVGRNVSLLAWVRDAIVDAHHYEEPVILVREDWASRAAYDPRNDNPNRWRNNGRGLPDRIDWLDMHSVCTAGAELRRNKRWFARSLPAARPLPRKRQSYRVRFIARMVEPRGIEPLTSCMPCKRSPS